MPVKETIDKHANGTELSNAERSELEQAGIVVENNPNPTPSTEHVKYTAKTSKNTITCVSCGFKSILTSKVRTQQMAQRLGVAIETMTRTYLCRKCRASRRDGDVTP